MGDADASLVDRQRLGDLAGVGDDGVARQAHIFPAAGRPRGGKKEPVSAGSMATDGAGLACDPFDGARAGFERAQPCRRSDSAQLFAKLARAENELRPVGLDQALEPVLRERRIDQRGRVTGRGRGEQADHRFGIGAAEQKDELLSLRGDFAREVKARGASSARVSQTSLRSSRIAGAASRGAIGGSRPPQERSRSFIDVRRNRGPAGAFRGPSYDEAAVNPDDLSRHIGRKVGGEKQDRIGDVLRDCRPGPSRCAIRGFCACPRGWT